MAPHIISNNTYLLTMPGAWNNKYQQRDGCMHDKFHSPLLVAREPSGVSKESADAFDGEVRAADRQFIQGDTPFSPEIYVSGEPRQLCFPGRNEAEVNAVCKAAGFPFGGSIVKRTDDVFRTDAIPVSACIQSTFFFLHPHILLPETRIPPDELLLCSTVLDCRIFSYF
jgi:hypothetical protein